MAPKAVVLVSGGLDSATALAVAKSQGFACYALSFDYGQRHRCELEAARRTCEQGGVEDHVVIALDLRRFGGSALTADVDVPKDRPADEMETGIPITYVPARNTVFLSIALFLYWTFDHSLLTLLWMVEVFAAYSISLYVREEHFRYAAIVGLGLCLIRLIFWDLNQSTWIMRALVFLGVGFIMILMNTLYNRFRDRLDSNKENE